MLPVVRASGSRHLVDGHSRCLPPGITSVTWGIYTLTSTVTAVTAAFHIQEECAGDCSASSTKMYLPVPSSRQARLQNQRRQDGRKQERADRCRRVPPQRRGHMARRPTPGSFHSLIPGQPHYRISPYDKQPPWDEPASDRRGIRGLDTVLGLEAWDGYWQGTGIPWLRLRERVTFQWVPSHRHVLTLAARRADLQGASSSAGR